MREIKRERERDFHSSMPFEVYESYGNERKDNGENCKLGEDMTKAWTSLESICWEREREREREVQTFEMILWHFVYNLHSSHLTIHQVYASLVWCIFNINYCVLSLYICINVKNRIEYLLKQIMTIKWLLLE